MALANTGGTIGDLNLQKETLDVQVNELINDCSLDLVGRHLAEMPAAATLLPLGTLINVGMAPSESTALFRETAATIAAHRHVPVPHIAARRLASAEVLSSLLAGLAQDGTADHLLILGGDPSTPQGPFNSALDVITTSSFNDHGATTIGISGYPEGHPKIPEDVLWDSLRAKAIALTELGASLTFYTQFALTAEPVIAWIERVRAEGISAPIRVGVCGPMMSGSLRLYSQRIGIDTSTDSVHDFGYGFDETPHEVTPNRLIEELARQLDPVVHGTVHIHLFSLGGFEPTARWIHDTVRN